MKKLWLVARHEYQRNVKRRSFLLALFSLPLIAAVVVVVALLLGGSGGSDAGPIAVGYVDRAGLLTSTTVPVRDEEIAVRWISLSSEQEARRALEQGDVLAYFVLPADYLRSREIDLFYNEGIEQDTIDAFADLLRTNLLADYPPAIAHRVVAGFDQVIRLPDGREFSGGLTLNHFLPALTGLVIVVLIFFSSGYLMQAVSDEKANRTMEIMATSLSPEQLMAGKVLGIAALSLTQLIAWIALGALTIIVGGPYLGLTWLQGLSLDASTVLLVLGLVVPAYIFAAALMTAIGATMAEARASQQVMGVFVSLYMLPLGFLASILDNLNGALAVGLSIFPLTSPVFLPLRAAFTSLPWWQIAASLGLQWLCALAALWLAGRAVRLGMLRYGRALRWDELLGRSRAQESASPRRVSRARPATRSATGRFSPRSKSVKILLHELVFTVTRPYFILMLLGLPLLLFVQMLAFDMMADDRSTTAVSPTEVSTTASPPGEARTTAQGYVDRAGLIQAIPAQVPGGSLLAYPDEAGAREALQSGRIAAYYIIPADYVENGELTVVLPAYSLVPRQSGWMSWTLLVNLLDGDVDMAARIWDPMQVHPEALAPVPSAAAQAEADERAEDEARITSMLLLLVFYAVIVMAASFLLRSVSEEKKNQTIEVLLLSASPTQILAGKTIALGLVGLLQAVGWTLIGYALFSLGGIGLHLPVGIDLSASALAWMMVFLVMGYAVYASLFAGAGALVPNWKEASGVTLLLVLPALIGFEISLFQADTPHSALMTAASIFPLTAPFTMVKRLIHGGVPLWQLLLSVGLMLFTAYAITRAVARVFRAQHLLSGQRFSWKSYLSALLGRA